MKFHMRRQLLPLLLAATAVTAAQAQETVTVTADPVRLLDGAASEAATGLSLALNRLPRAATQVSETTLSRYGVSGLDDLTAITPGSYTASFYGVDGSVNLRGTLAENYFRGFKRAENRGTYATPLLGEITILRGPPTPVMGAGKVGGMVDFAPTPVHHDSITLTYGAYDQRQLAAQAGLGLTMAGAEGRVSARASVEDSYSFYRGLHPRRQSLALSADLAQGGWSLSADYLFFHAAGEVQTPGWNRLTQALIDRGDYITGRDKSLADADGNGRLTLNEMGGNPYVFDPAFRPLAITGGSDAAHRLDAGLGVARLSRRTVHLADADFSRTDTHTAFLELRQALGADSLRLQLFGDALDNDRFVSYGFPASLRARIGEARLRYDFDRQWGGIAARTVAGASWRITSARDRQSFNSGVIALDRRDLTQGAMPNDIIDSPFNRDAPGVTGLSWESDLDSRIGNTGLFAYTDLAHGGLHLLLGARYDAFHVSSRDSGVLAYAPPAGRANGDRLSWSASLSFQSQSGLTPYVTHARSHALEAGQAGEIPTTLLVNGGWLSSSTLDEAGVKYAAPDLEAGLSLYRQSRTRLSQLGGVSVTGTRGEGVELELRWLASDRLSATLAASLQRTTIKGPDTSFAYVPARNLGVSPQDGFGGSYIVYDFSTLKGAGDYDNSLMPRLVVSPALAWSDASWGAVLAATYVGATRQTVPDPVVFPSYVTVNASAYLRWDNWTAALNLDNALDARFFTPDADVYANLGALPGLGRRWRLSLTRYF
jgi:iron complex outermembrane receptor protein